MYIIYAQTHMLLTTANSRQHGGTPEIFLLHQGTPKSNKSKSDGTMVELERVGRYLDHGQVQDGTVIDGLHGCRGNGKGKLGEGWRYGGVSWWTIVK